jgi:hypothetical protein
MAEERGRIIERRKLENGIELILYDRSRIMSGDRWLVELVCEAHVPVADKSWDFMTEEELQLIPEIRKMLGEKLSYSSSKTRTFVDGKEKEAALQEMMQQVYDSTLKYLKRHDFPGRLLKKQYRDARQQVMLREAMQKTTDD